VPLLTGDPIALTVRRCPVAAIGSPRSAARAATRRDACASGKCVGVAPVQGARGAASSLTGGRSGLLGGRSGGPADEGRPLRGSITWSRRARAPGSEPDLRPWANVHRDATGPAGRLFHFACEFGPAALLWVHRNPVDVYAAPADGCAGRGPGGLCNPFRVHPSPNRAGRGAASMVPSFQNWEIASVARRSTAACDRQKRRACGVTGGLIKRAEAIATLCVWSERARRLL
jgi:hypothetical protein